MRRRHGGGVGTDRRAVVAAVAAGWAGVLALATAGLPPSALAGAAPSGPATSGPAVGVSAPPVPLAPRSAAYVVRLEFDGTARDYRLHVPPAAAGGRPLALVLNLHGATQNGWLQEIYSQMDASADRDGYLVAYPDGTPYVRGQAPDLGQLTAQDSWDAGGCCGLPVSAHVDDVGFLLDVISSIAARTPVDRRRVYVTGMSAGGMMAYRMAAEASTHVAAIASVSGQVEQPAVHPRRPVPTMEFHSVDDPIATWSGGPSPHHPTAFSVMAGVRRWVRADGCPAAPRVGRTLAGAAGSTGAGETATLLTWSPCRHGAQVDLWRLTGSGHVWPGSPFNTGAPSTWILQGVGRGTTLLDADQLMWAFFSRHELPGTGR